ncbi:MAG: GFA family protein [Alphaproteobacteria bacterium]
MLPLQGLPAPTGSAFVINAIIETDRIEISKERPVAVTVPTDSGRPHDIYRCPKCQIAVWSDCGRRPGLRFVRAATLDDPSAIKPDAHIFTRPNCLGSR